MRQVTRKGLITAAAAGGVLATFSGGTAFADQGVQGAAGNSPGVLSGNNMQAPVNAPVTVCGNTMNVIGVLNPVSGVSCQNGGTSSVSGSSQSSPGVGSGNNVEVPINAPVDVCGNSASVIGVGNSAAGADCGGDTTTPPVDDEPDNPGPDNPGPEDPGPEDPGPDTPGPDTPGSETPGDGGEGSSETTPASDVRTQSEPTTDQLAHTGAGDMVGIGAPLSAGLLIGGFVLYRRASRLARR